MPTLLVPGPTPLLPAVRTALAQQPLPHRSEAFVQLHRRNLQRLGDIFRAEGPTLALPGSGTTAFEAAALSLTSPGQTVVVGVSGKFGARWAKVFGRLRERSGVRVETATAPWGEPLSPARLSEAMDRCSRVDLVALVHCETSTATTNDLAALTQHVRERAPGALVLADCVSALAALPLEQRAWGVDVCVAASQKGLSAPAGLGFVSLGERALEQLRREEGLAPLVLDLRWWLEAFETHGGPATTPPVHVHLALAAALDALEARTLDGWISDTRRRAQATRRAVEAMGLQLASTAPSDAVTAIEIPQGLAEELRARCAAEEGVLLAGGQEAWKGRVVRISHMGALTDEDALAGVRAVARQAAAMGIVDDATAQAAIAAAQTALQEEG